MEPTRPGALHARLVKRTAPEEGVAAATGFEVRGAPQHVA
jgi:hypothetical protein